MDIPSNLRGYFARRWFLHGGEEHERLLNILAAGISVCEEIAEKVLKEILVQTAEESLVNYEKELGLLSGENLSLEERQNRIIARNYERGGPTNTPDFERALSTLANAKAKVIPFYADFSVVYQLALNNHFQLNLGLLEEYVRRNKLAHLYHSFEISPSVEIIEIVETAKVNRRRYHKVHEFRVGMTPIKYQDEVII
ncbi:DUF2313 domain-containing protein [Brevibacillus laterosporus]|uniref:putative phage tail protein n=1 Tax=Brevibacillus laterosporus TaxID=1465 RepID=UPI0018CC8AA8|nr:putative phage tail protein [Brevibacillus laterosporus]MBG9798452.1 hypothetical protein [Brevibacillus laterosporus]MCR8940423.1 YmfQ family protein [Brevibacillus laterosporus]MCZ0843062.1 DUF2313 domain-containing protein [Brevibacillus laterosporus]MCZ0847660.1 DUF2313 domain-containing protein [Brevibacillus laterosporus]MED1913325.1 DUF2313 domain-containing protein [Brevibacillus laterosporus]